MCLAGEDWRGEPHVPYSAGNAVSPDYCLCGGREHPGSWEDNLGLACVCFGEDSVGMLLSKSVGYLHLHGGVGKHSDSYILQLLGFAQLIAKEGGRELKAVGERC